MQVRIFSHACLATGPFVKGLSNNETKAAGRPGTCALGKGGEVYRRCCGGHQAVTKPRLPLVGHTPTK